MRINDYELTFDPEAFDNPNSSEFNEIKVPFGENVIFDLNATTSTYTFDIILVDKEIYDIKGMLEGYKLIFIDFDELYGFFYVTKFDLSWVKKLDNIQLASYSLEGYYCGNNAYLKLGSFSDTQKTDFNLTCDELICVPEYYTSKVSETKTYEVTNTTESDSHLLYYINPVNEIYFKADPGIFKDACIKSYKDGVRCYGDKNEDGEILIDTNLLTYVYPDEDASKVMDVYDYNGTLINTLTDGLNSVTSNDSRLKPGPFNTEIKANHTRYLFKVNRDYFEIKNTPTAVTHTSKNYYVSCKPDCVVGNKELTTANPATLMVDKSILTGTPGTTLSYDLSPLFVKYTSGDTYVIGTFSTANETHPLNGFYANTERNYVMHNPYTPSIATASDFTLSSFTYSATGGGTYNGVVDYVYSSTANATALVNVTTLDGFYDVYIMASNYDTCPAGTYEFYLDTTLEGETTDLLWTVADTKANFVYLGNYDLSVGSHEFKIKLKTGKIALFYLLLMPTTLEAGAPYENCTSALLDTHESYEVGD